MRSPLANRLFSILMESRTVTASHSSLGIRHLFGKRPNLKLAGSRRSGFRVIYGVWGNNAGTVWFERHFTAEPTYQSSPGNHFGESKLRPRGSLPVSQRH